MAIKILYLIIIKEIIPQTPQYRPKCNLEIIEKIVENLPSKQDETSNFSNSNIFDSNIETSWGGDEPSILTFFKVYV